MNTIMKLQFILLIWIAWIYPAEQVWAQSQSKIDSLNSLLRNSGQDSIRIKIYAELCWLYAGTREKTESARKYADSILLLSEPSGNQSGIALAHFYYGIIDRFEGKFDQALEHLDDYISYQAGRGDSSRVATGLFQIGAIHISLGDYENSLATLYRALRIHEEAGNLSGINFILNAIGTVYKTSGRYEEAIEMYDRVLKTDSLDADVLMNLGNAYLEGDHLEKAMFYYRKAARIDRERGNEWALAYDLENIGTLFNRMKSYDSALVYHLQAMAIRDVLPGKMEKSLSLSQIGLTYIYLYNYVQAEKYLFKALDLAGEIKSGSLQRDIYEKLSLLYENQGDFNKAFFYYRSQALLKDSLLNEENLKRINELNTRYETAKKDKEITLLSKEKELQEKETQRQALLKKAFIGGFLFMLMLAGLILYTLRQKLRIQKVLARKDNEIREAHFKRRLTDLEMKALQAQINPHFIFNCMNSINQMILGGEIENASKYLTKFSKLIRLILENAEASEVSLKDEITLLESYIELEELRFNGQISYRIRINENIDPEMTHMPSMVLQPFVENAIWHGLLPKKAEGTGFITIDIKQKEDSLICLIEDNGIGREKAFELQEKSVYKSKSLGLKITEERLKLLSNSLQRQLIRITDLKDALGQALGTRVEVNIPTI